MDADIGVMRDVGRMGMSLRAVVRLQVAAAGAGIAILAGFITAAGIDYRIREDQGLPPVYTPAWMVTWMQVGTWLFGIACLSLLVTGVALLWRRRSTR